MIFDPLFYSSLSSMATSAGWADTPSDILWNVLKRLQIIDHVRAGAVCISWCSVLSQKLHPPAPQAPWLYLPTTTVANFINISENKTYRICIPPGKKITGSSEGWLILVEEGSLYEVMPFHIFDPLSGTCLPLPSITTLPYVTMATRNSEGQINGYSMLLGWTWVSLGIAHHRIVSKMVVSSSSRGSIMVAAIWRNILTFCRVGDESWQNIEVPHRECIRYRSDVYFSDVIFYKEQIFVLRLLGEVLAYDFTTDTWNSPILTLGLPPYDDCLSAYYQDSFRYLVETCEGYLLQVLKRFDYRQRKRVVFRVFLLINQTENDNESMSCERYDYMMTNRMDEGDEYLDNKIYKSYWLELKSLGGNALFVGHNHSMTLPVHELPELRKNCIYFTDNRHFHWSWEEFCHAICDLGVYNMEDKTTLPYFQGQYPLSRPPVWFTLKLLGAQGNQQN